MHAAHAPHATAGVHPHLPLAPVATMLTADERLRVDAAGQGLYWTMHRDTLDDVIRDVRERGASAVVVSVSRCSQRDAARVATMVREFPRVPAVALLTQLEPATPQAVLSLGRSGVRTLVDARGPAGWRQLRDALMVDHAGDLARAAATVLDRDLAGAPDTCRRFFDALFASPAHVSTVRQLARAFHVTPSTLMSRFFRAHLPAPKRYLATARLARAAHLFESPGLSVCNVADHLEYSSAQSFGRHVRTVLGMTAGEFRRRYDGEGMLQRFRDELVTPHRDVLRTFEPWRER
jgi:AraC-like DNA-binding protein